MTDNGLGKSNDILIKDQVKKEIEFLNGSSVGGIASEGVVVEKGFSTCLLGDLVPGKVTYFIGLLSLISV